MKCLAKVVDIINVDKKPIPISKITRVSNEKAEEMVKMEGWKYIPKSKWKKEGRPR